MVYPGRRRHAFQLLVFAKLPLFCNRAEFVCTCSTIYTHGTIPPNANSREGEKGSWDGQVVEMKAVPVLTFENWDITHLHAVNGHGK